MRRHGRPRTRFGAKCEALRTCNITLSLGRLSDLVPCFRDRLTRPPNLSVVFVASTHTYHIRDEHCPTISLSIKDQEIPGLVIDGGSGVNVISEATCLGLRLRQWELCPFRNITGGYTSVRARAVPTPPRVALARCGNNQTGLAQGPSVLSPQWKENLGQHYPTPIGVNTSLWRTNQSRGRPYGRRSYNVPRG